MTAVLDCPAAERVDKALALVEATRDDGAFWALDAALARRRAADVDARARRGRPGSLSGWPVAVKACIDVAGLPTTVGVDHAAPPARTHAVLVARLRRAGAVPIGKTAMDQLAWSTGGQAPGHLPVRNPACPGRSPGGSSSGSAAAVAAGVTPVALGTDTAGSVRVPASYCGVVGLKPPSRALTRAGCVRIAPSFEVPGVLARSVGECRRAYEALTERPLGAASGPLRIGRLDDLLDEAEPDIALACRDALALLGAPHSVAPARLDWRPAGFGRVLAADLAATWGHRVASHPERFTEDIAKSVALGRQVREGDRREILAAFATARRRLAARLASFDVLACPTVPHRVPAAGDDDVGEATCFTRPFNALGWPALSLPCGRDARGGPIGLQLVSVPSRLGKLLRAAEIIATATAMP